MSLYDTIRLAVVFGGLGFSIGAFAAHYHRTQRQVRENAERIGELEDDETDSGVDP